MHTTRHGAPDARRRALSFGTAALALRAWACTMAWPAQAAERTRFNLADFGGVPGARPATLVDAFEQAFDEIKASGRSCELVVPPGVYEFGKHAAPGNTVFVEGLHDVFIYAYGARFRLNTTENIIPCLFYFSNPNNVTLAGASFNDIGYVPDVNWRGMYCARAEATRACSGFRMIDCDVNGAVGMFASQSHGDNKFLMRDISLHGRVRNAYYGAGLTYVGDNARLDLVCENVRRGCIAYGLKNAGIMIRMNHDATALGSNGFISLTCEGESAGNVENVRVDLRASGVGNHSGLVHFYHQQTEALGLMRNIDATVTLDNYRPGSETTSLFVFDHEVPGMKVLSATKRGWDQISLHGSVAKGFSGRIVHNPSVSRYPGRIYVDGNLAGAARMSRLPRYFHVR